MTSRPSSAFAHIHALFFANGNALQRFLLIGAICFLPAAAFYFFGYISNTHGFTDSAGNPTARDFIVFWSAAQLLKGGHIADAYNMGVFEHYMHSFYAGALTGLNWRYPPPMLFFIWPLTFFTSYAAAAAYWVVTNLLLFAAACAGKSFGPRWQLVLFSALCVIINCVLSQTGVLWAAFLIAGMRLLSPAPVLAGMAFSLLIIKPHFALLIPFILIALRQYKALLSLAFSSIFLVLISAYAFGWDCWIGFLGGVLQIGQFQSMGYPVGGTFSLYALAWLGSQTLGIKLIYFNCIYASIVIFVIIFLFKKLRAISQAHWSELLLLITPAIYLVSPYGLIYDLCLLSAAWILWLAHHKDEPLTGTDVTLWLCAWYAPILWNLPMGELHFYSLFPLLGLFFCLFIRQVRAQTHAQLLAK